MRRPIHTASITGDDEWTESILGSKYDTFSVSLDGTFEATVAVQRSLDGVNWKTVETFDAPREFGYEFLADELIRVGVPEGAFTSGPVEIQIAE